MTETQVAEVRRDHSALLQAFIDLGNEVLGLREEYRKALEQVDAVRATLASVQRERDEARAEVKRLEIERGQWTTLSTLTPGPTFARCATAHSFNAYGVCLACGTRKAVSP